MDNKQEYIIPLGKKVSEKHIDTITTSFYNSFKAIKKFNRRYIFNFFEIEWISNQELLVLTAFLKYLIESKVAFKVNFLNNGSSEGIDKRRASQLVQIWDVWKIHQIIPDRKYNLYFDIDGNVIDRLKERYNIKLSTQEIYNQYGVTPFIYLDKINNYDDKSIGLMLNSVYRLNKATDKILQLHNCIMPFENKTLSSIITKELYENFLDHFKKTFFETEVNYAFMSISLKAKFNKSEYSEDKIQYILERNFYEESLPELKSFLFDEEKKRFKNLTILQFSFLDFGEGIAKTLLEEYNRLEPSNFSEEHYKRHIDTKVLEYAFRFDSSKDPISRRYLEKSIIPRGLFDLLSIVKRFEGLLVARSNFGKILYDFSNNKTIEQSLKYFGDETLFFPGTLISIYIPERSFKNKIDSTTIKPFNISINFTTHRERKHISLFEIQREIKNSKVDKSLIYNLLFDHLHKEITFKKNEKLIFIDFEGFEIDERISKKIVYFILSDYNINQHNSVIVLNPPPLEFIKNIQNELSILSDVVKQFNIHPTPFIFYNKKTDELTVYWLGVFSDADIHRLNDLLLDDHDLRSSDFEYSDGIVGNVNYYDQFGNLKSLLNREEIISLFKGEVAKARDGKIDKIITSCIKKEKDKIFLCNGNYYQYEYLQLFDALSNNEHCEYLSTALFNKLLERLENLSQYKFLCITSSSQKITDFLVKANHIAEENIISLDNYHSFYQEDNFSQRIKYGNRIVLICDVISTGYLTAKLELNLHSLGASLEHIAVLVDAIDVDFEPKINFYEALRAKMTFLYQYTMKKYRRKDIEDLLKSRQLEVIRINPYTNTPITLSIHENGFKPSVLLSNQEFIDLIEDEHVKIGYFKFNNLIHPYFFDMDNILKSEQVSKKLLIQIIERIDQSLILDLDIIFYPKNSGIKGIDFIFFKDKVLKNQKVKVFELDRFPTNEGWRFPHPPKSLFDITENKKAMILDDGSCSGESIIQMIDEVASFNVEEIIVLSIIGRVSDHKKDFFSRLEAINNGNKKVKITILFGSHWHLPTYYIEESPIMKEKQWLEEIIKLQNIPFRIKTIAEKELEELQLKNIKDGNNKNLLVKKDNSSIIKAQTLKKEEVGKITTYRFYKEYFDFFNEFINSYTTSSEAYNDNFIQNIDKNYHKYESIELICAVFLHEPNLFEKAKTVLPDLVEKIEEFVLNILFSNYKGQNIKKELYHKWTNTNLIHLFFIVFKEDQLLDTLTSKRLENIISEYCRKEQDLNYLLFRLLTYIPVNITEIEAKKWGGKMKHLIEVITETPELDNNITTQFKTFRSFISTLPFSESDFHSLLIKIKNNYSKLREDKYHNEYIFNDKQVLISQLTVLFKKKKDGDVYEKEIRSIQKAWSSISTFIEDLLSFSISYPSFFLPYKEKTYNNLEKINVSLRKLHGKLQDEIYSGSFNSIPEIIELVNNLFENFIMEDSEYSEIFDSISTPDLQDECKKFVDALRIEYKSSIIKHNPPKNITIDFPKIYLRHIVFKEIKENLRHADLSKELEFQWEDNQDQIIFKIKNTMKDTNDSKGGGKGIARLNQLNQFPIKMHYKMHQEEVFFCQEISFKKL
ncbi:hypothetical protein QNI19_38635 [Cytophagaceae bacterium DM2B3-1]|uniref:Phosphoribosyltransferase domain-containing protein n=1 Tax=Xanthocytophaga flava TaxID=3048013 RepID=A0ABT7D2A8_9BACT|nr:hypothetical protein [Xanthocytophaga flavus]MDJ1498909.1 hypothetical protein [Xanthocytophaga flavus]